MRLTEAAFFCSKKKWEEKPTYFKLMLGVHDQICNDNIAML